MNCPKCGTPAAPNAGFCNLCGASFVAPPPMMAGGYNPYGQPMMGPQRTSGLAIAGFVLSLVACGILGLIFSIMGKNEIQRSGGTVGGQGLATAGMVISIIRLVLEVIYILVIIVAIAGSSGHHSY